MKLDMNEIEARIASGHIRRQFHPEDPSMMILNYTAKTQIERAWDQYTMLTRGLIVRNGEIYARSFDKFFNLNEVTETQVQNLPSDEPVITAKMDGYLGVSYWHNDKICVASRGSFTSEYAVWATNWLQEQYPNLHEQIIDREWTFVFEILYPHRRIVVDNSDKYGLVLLAIVHTSGHEMPRAQMEQVADLCGFNVVRLYSFGDVEECVKAAARLEGIRDEGYVLYYPSTGLRAKVKGSDYCRIHKLVVGLSKRRVWDILANGNDPAKAIEDLVSYLPEAYANWVNETADTLLLEHASYMHVASVGKSENFLVTERKELVEKLQKDYPTIWHEILYMIDGKVEVASASFWKRLKPAHEVPLLSEGEDE